MSQLFFGRLMLSPQKRLDLKLLRSTWLDCFPEQLQTHDRDRLLLDALRQGEQEGLLKLPAKQSYERLGNPPMPTFITLIREPKKVSDFDFAKVAWAPEMGFWTSLSASELVTALKINEWIIRRSPRCQGSCRISGFIQSIPGAARVWSCLSTHLNEKPHC